MRVNIDIFAHNLKTAELLCLFGFFVIIMLVSAITFKLFTAKNKGAENDMPTFVVKRGPLRINIVEAGTIQAREQVVLKSQVEGRTTILSLVPEHPAARYSIPPQLPDKQRYQGPWFCREQAKVLRNYPARV